MTGVERRVYTKRVAWTLLKTIGDIYIYLPTFLPSYSC